MGAELKPCPFCGGTPERWEPDGQQLVTCRGSAVHSPIIVRAEHWNTRHTEGVPVATLGELVAKWRFGKESVPREMFAGVCEGRNLCADDLERALIEAGLIKLGDNGEWLLKEVAGG